MKSIRHYINLVESLSEAPADPKFMNFMNTALGKKVDSTSAPDTPEPNFMKNAPTYGLESQGYKAALDFGMKTLAKLNPSQKIKLATKGEEGVVDWLASQAKKAGLLTTDADDEGAFMREDLDEAQEFLPEVFKDPSIKSWALVLTDGEPLPKPPTKGPFTVSLNKGFGPRTDDKGNTSGGGYSSADWKDLDTLENLPDAVELAKGLAQKNPKYYVAIWDAKSKPVKFYQPGKGWN